MEAKLKHLEFIQATVSRMAGNSFLLKGWAITIASALLAVSFKEMDVGYVLVSFVMLFFFWLLDSYYLSHEQMFRKLYDKVCALDPHKIDFSMNTKAFRRRGGILRCTVSTSMVLFYGGLFVVHLLTFYRS